jgi:hypothetical protein
MLQRGPQTFAVSCNNFWEALQRLDTGWKAKTLEFKSWKGKSFPQNLNQIGCGAQ